MASQIGLLDGPNDLCCPVSPRPYLHGCVDSGVAAQTEVSSRHVVADGGGDDAHGDAELLVVFPALGQLQGCDKSLQWEKQSPLTCACPPPMHIKVGAHWKRKLAQEMENNRNAGNFWER